MAISKNIVSLNPGFARTDVIYQLEQQFADLNLHGTGHSGLIVGVSSYTDPGQVSNVSAFYEDVRQTSTTGIGTGASFYVRRQSGYVQEVRPNRPGKGYAAGDVITLSAEDTGGSANGANDIIVTPVMYAHKTSDAQTYDVTLSGLYEISGTDRNGTISGKTITIKEGDTIRFTDNLADASYGFIMCWDRGPYLGQWNAADSSNRYYGSAFNCVFNALYNSSGGGGGNIITWSPECGQTGVFRILDNSIGLTDPITIIVEADNSNWGYPTVGSATTFYTKFKDPQAIHPWATLKHDIEPNKKYGSTYRTFQVQADDNMSFHVGSDFLPNVGISTIIQSGNSHTSPYHFNSYRGEIKADYSTTIVDAYNIFYDNTKKSESYTGNQFHCQIRSYDIKFTESNSYQLDLTSYKSGLNPRFVVYSYRQPTRSSTSLSGNTYATFILHDHIGTIWDHDNAFTSGVTTINWGLQEEVGPYIEFKTYLTGEHYQYQFYNPSQRAGEYGYLNTDFENSADYNNTATSTYHPNSYKMGNKVSSHDSRIYYRGLEDRDPTSMTADIDFNAVIKGIPINTNLIPFPFYIPDDFVLIQFDHAAPNANIQQGDTVTISGSEIYEVIVGAYNQTTRTRGILFCARTT